MTFRIFSDTWYSENKVWYWPQVHVGTNEGFVEEKDLPLLWLENLTFIPINFLSKKLTMNQLPLFWVQQLETKQVTGYKMTLPWLSFRGAALISQATSPQNKASYLKTYSCSADQFFDKHDFSGGGVQFHFTSIEKKEDFLLTSAGNES